MFHKNSDQRILKGSEVERLAPNENNDKLNWKKPGLLIHLHPKSVNGKGLFYTMESPYGGTDSGPS